MSARRGALALGVLALLGFAAAAGPARAGGFEGSWVRSESQREADAEALGAEIDRVTESMSVFTRGLSRAFLRRHVRPTEHYRIAAEDGVLVIREPEIGASWRVDGRPESRDSGEVTSRLEAPDRIRQEWGHGDTHGVTVWRLAPSEDALRIAITAHHARLPEPLRYRIHYERGEPR